MLKANLRNLLSDLLNEDFTLTKRHLGYLLAAGGMAILLAAGLAEIIRSAPGGFGTVQQIAVLAGLASLVVGLTLLPLADRPA